MTTIAPWEILRDLSGIIRSISNSILYPRPKQSGQAPNGLLNEKLLGSILINTDLTIRAGKALTECLHSTIHRIYHKQPIRKIQNCLNGIRQSFLDSRFYYQTVYDNFYIMFDVFIQFNFFRQLIQISINLYTYITAAFRLIQKLCMCSLSTTELPVPEAAALFFQEVP